MNVTCGRAKGLKKMNKEYQAKIEHEAIKDANMAYDPNEYGWHSRYSGFKIGATFGYIEGKQAAFKRIVNILENLGCISDCNWNEKCNCPEFNDVSVWLTENKDKILKGSE
jgi:hypothetical protein